MAGNQLALTNVVTVSVSESNLGVNAYNTSNLAIFTSEHPNLSSFGSLGYALYVTPDQVGTDFGSSSRTFAMANAVFSQQPNILAGGGQLVVILLGVEVQTVTPSAAPASGTFELGFTGGNTTALQWNDGASTIQAAVRLVPGMEDAVVAGTLATHLTITYYGVYGNIGLCTIPVNTLNGGITLTPAQTTAGETIGAAITRTASLVQYFGIMVDANVATLGNTDVQAAAAIVLPLNKIAFWVSNDSNDINPGGTLDVLRSGGFVNSRGLYYGDDNDDELADIVMMASYAGRGLSTNFEGSNTTSTMHLKTLSGVEPDPSMTQTILNLALAAGADTYVSLQGDPCVFTSGANLYFDQIYNRLWFVGALQVAGFNYLAQTGTKVPQTENGMSGLVGRYRSVCVQAVTNGYLAPGTWNSSTSFGPGTALVLNVAQQGFYLYSLPVALQSQVARVARDAPLVQIAAKEAGAIQNSDVIVNVNA
jgi:hypothetical protein